MLEKAFVTGVTKQFQKAKIDQLAADVQEVKAQRLQRHVQELQEEAEESKAKGFFGRVFG